MEADCGEKGIMKVYKESRVEFGFGRVLVIATNLGKNTNFSVWLS